MLLVAFVIGEVEDAPDGRGQRRGDTALVHVLRARACIARSMGSLVFGTPLCGPDINHNPSTACRKYESSLYILENQVGSRKNHIQGLKAKGEGQFPHLVLVGG